MLPPPGRNHYKDLADNWQDSVPLTTAQAFVPPSDYRIYSRSGYPFGVETAADFESALVKADVYRGVFVVRCLSDDTVKVFDVEPVESSKITCLTPEHGR